MSQRSYYIILFCIALMGVAISYVYARPHLHGFWQVQNARIALQKQDPLEAQMYLKNLGEKGDYLRSYVAYYTWDWKQVETYMTSNPNWQELYMLGNTYYYLWKQVSTWQEQEALWWKALRYYEQAQLKKDHPHIQSNIVFIQEQLQMNKVAHEDLLEAEKQGAGEVLVWEETPHTVTNMSTPTLNPQQIRDIEVYTQELMDTSSNVHNTTTSNEPVDGMQERDW